jgi:mevalonate kinase
MTSASAPGKIILCGEHAVVYDQPAIAIPVTQVRATARIEAAPDGSGLIIDAQDINRRVEVSRAGAKEPLAAAARVVLGRVGAPIPDATITLTSSIPVASGLGSGAAVSTAIIRALALFLGHDLQSDQISQLVYEVEKLHHGTPSGIDNTVIAHERPVYFVRGRPLETFRIGAPLRFLVADSGLHSSTREMVAGVRAAWQAEPARLERIFDVVGILVREARRAIETGAAQTLGELMNENHALLVQMGVSSPALERLTDSARRAGALGAKLSGAGGGGNVIALVEEENAEDVERALNATGAHRVILTTAREDAHATQE